MHARQIRLPSTEDFVGLSFDPPSRRVTADIETFIAGGGELT
jgi:hypothetical protein